MQLYGVGVDAGNCSNLMSVAGQGAPGVAEFILVKVYTVLCVICLCRQAAYKSLVVGELLLLHAQLVTSS